MSADGKRNTLQEYLKYPASQSVASVSRTVFYGYDAAGRLNAEQRQSISTLAAGGDPIKNTARTMWTYDKVGNRLTQAVSNYDGIGVPGDPGATGVLKSTFNTSYSYNINDWLNSTTSVRNDDSGESTFVTNFEYDQNGSQKAVTSNVGRPEEKRVPYFYDFEEKLTVIGNPTDTVKRAYAYDADGNRIAESNTNAGNTTVRNYLVDPNNSNAQIVEEYDNANALQAHYDWNDAELLREASWNTNTNAYDIREPIADGHNSTRQLLDSTGSISDMYVFDAWGNQQVNIGESFNPYRYNSQRLDVSGLYYLRARQYSSGIGRFLTHDPVMGDMNNPITQHRYLYAGDDVINFVDPSGKEDIAGELATIGISTSLSSVTFGTIYSRALGGSFVEGAIVGARLGAVTSVGLIYEPEFMFRAVLSGVGNGLASTIIFVSANGGKGGSYNPAYNPDFRNATVREFIKGFTSGVEGIIYGQGVNKFLGASLNDEFESNELFTSVVTGFWASGLSMLQDTLVGENDTKKIFINALAQGIMAGVSTWSVLHPGQAGRISESEANDWATLLAAPVFSTGTGLWLSDLFDHKPPDFP